jgi:hypothetical protein
MLAIMESRPCRVAAGIAREPSGSMARERCGPAARLAPPSVDPLLVPHVRVGEAGGTVITVGPPDPKLMHAPIHRVPGQSVPRAHMQTYLSWQTCDDLVPVE